MLVHARALDAWRFAAIVDTRALDTSRFLIRATLSVMVALVISLPPTESDVAVIFPDAIRELPAFESVMVRFVVLPVSVTTCRSGKVGKLDKSPPSPLKKTACTVPLAMILSPVFMNLTV